MVQIPDEGINPTMQQSQMTGTINIWPKNESKFMKTNSVQILVATLKSSSGNGGGTAAALRQHCGGTVEKRVPRHCRQRAVQGSVLCCSDDELPVPEAKLR